MNKPPESPKKSQNSLVKMAVQLDAGNKSIYVKVAED